MRDTIIDILREILADPSVLDEEVELADELDSLELFALVDELQTRFNIEVTADDMKEENFMSVDAIILFVENKKNK
ncbi:MAG: hypothetical protein K5894_13040 [Lachnospiraceae bacterium]|nr:hypothetical protein [Lachnospiraceae bacterium]